jgi:hypothetical protein
MHTLPFLVLRGECACTPVRFFVIISMQRSGSGWFETLLNSHPNVSSSGEIFSVKDRRDNLSSILRTLDKLYNMDWLTSAAKNECTAAFGLKWMLNQVSPLSLGFFRLKAYSVTTCFESTNRLVAPGVSNHKSYHVALKSYLAVGMPKFLQKMVTDTPELNRDLLEKQSD